MANKHKHEAEKKIRELIAERMSAQVESGVLGQALDAGGMASVHGALRKYGVEAEDAKPDPVLKLNGWVERVDEAEVEGWKDFTQYLGDGPERVREGRSGGRKGAEPVKKRISPPGNGTNSQDGDETPCENMKNETPRSR